MKRNSILAVMALAVVWTPLTACLDSNTGGPEVVIETGYLTCEIDAEACGSDASCADGEAVSTCVDVPAACTEGLTCACFGTTACGSRACTDSDDGLSITCAAPEPEPATCEPGASFPSEDGCNTCSCPESGLLAEAVCDLAECTPTAGINVTPRNLEFGLTPVGTTKTVTFVLQSIGDAPLVIDGTTVAMSSPNIFEIVGAPTAETIVAAGASREITVSYTPTQASALNDAGEPIPDSGTLTFTSNAENELTTIVSFSGTATDDVVQSNPLVRVELTWDTPGDPDQTDEGPASGADLDLHIAHPTAAQPDLDGDSTPDPWFDPNSVWPLSASGNGWGGDIGEVCALLLQDDTDGAGPETIRLCDSIADGRYPVGVHYWNDHSYGASFATVRVFVRGNLVYDQSSVELESRDMWFVGFVDVVDGVATFSPRVESSFDPRTEDPPMDITPNYNHPAYTVDP